MFTISKEELKDLRKSKTVLEIAKMFHTSETTVRRRMREYGLIQSADRIDIKDSDVIQDWESGLTINQIAVKYCCSHDTVTKRLAKHNIACSRNEGIKRHFAPTYEDRWDAIKSDLDKGISVSMVRDLHHIRMENLRKLMIEHGYGTQSEQLLVRLNKQITDCDENKAMDCKKNYLLAIKSYIEENKKLPDLYALARCMNRNISTIRQSLVKFHIVEFCNMSSISSWVSVLLADLDRLHISYELNNRHILLTEQNTYQELDVYLPDRHLGLEINPVGTHSVDVGLLGLIDKDYHQKKSLLAEQHGIGLLHLYDDDFTDKAKYQKILMYLQNTNRIVVGARKCKVGEITAKVCNAFLAQYHFQGGCNASIRRIGLFYGDTLCGVLVLGKSRYTSHEYEIIRYCMRPEYAIAGSFGKLFSAFCKDCKPGDRIISYMDLNKRLMPNSIYDRYHFVYDGLTPPDYVWVNKYGTNTLKRYQTMKSRLVKEGYDEALSEIEIMKQRGYVRVYGAGSKRYVYTV